MASVHTLFPRGARIRIIMKKSGRQMICRFIEKLNEQKIRTDKGIVRIADVRSADFYKPLKHERKDFALQNPSYVESENDT